jgi:hypothetical protein
VNGICSALERSDDLSLCLTLEHGDNLSICSASEHSAAALRGRRQRREGGRSIYLLPEGR